MPISKINLFCPLQYYLTDNMDARIKTELTKLVLQLLVIVFLLHKYHFQLEELFCVWDSREKKKKRWANFSNQTCPSVLRHLIHLMYFQTHQNMLSKLTPWHVIILTCNMFILSPRDKDPELSPKICHFHYHTILSWGSILVMT